MDSLNDLETKIVSVIIVVLALTFLEEFTREQRAEDTSQFGVAAAVVVPALVAFQHHIARAKPSAPMSAAPLSAAYQDAQ